MGAGAPPALAGPFRVKPVVIGGGVRAAVGTAATAQSLPKSLGGRLHALAGTASNVGAASATRRPPQLFPQHVRAAEAQPLRLAPPRFAPSSAAASCAVRSAEATAVRPSAVSAPAFRHGESSVDVSRARGHSASALAPVGRARPSPVAAGADGRPPARPVLSKVPTAPQPHGSAAGKRLLEESGGSALAEPPAPAASIPGAAAGVAEAIAKAHRKKRRIPRAFDSAKEREEFLVEEELRALAPLLPAPVVDSMLGGPRGLEQVPSAAKREAQLVRIMRAVADCSLASKSTKLASVQIKNRLIRTNRLFLLLSMKNSRKKSAFIFVDDTY